MDQSTINQFFVARKSSSSSVLPASKRRKVDITRVVKEETKERVLRANPVGRSKPRRTNAKNTKKLCSKGGQTFFDMNDVFNAKALQDTSESVKNQSVNNKEKVKAGKKLTGEMKRILKSSTEEETKYGVEDEVFTTVKSKSGANKECPLTPVKTIPSTTDSLCRGEATNKCPVVTPVKVIPNGPKMCARKGAELPFNEDVNDQAKTILFSRGSTILRAGFDKNLIKSPSKVSEILSSLSPLKNYSNSERLTVIASPNKVQSQLKSPTKLSDILNTLSPRKQTKTAETVSSALTDNSNSERRARLRNKFKHLLKDDNTNTSVATTTLSQTKNPTMSYNEVDKPTKEKAHEKFKNLSQKSIPSSFVLPHKFKELLELFRCVDSILFLLNQRSEVCTFDKLKKSVQTMSGRDFQLNHLAAMKTVYPVGFTFRQEKGLHSSQGVGKSSMYQLTIEANFKESSLSNSNSNSSKINTNILITRRLCFENKLLDIVKAHHQKFLRKLNMKLCDYEIHRWHPHFKVNEVPDIELSKLPQAPINKGFTSAADLILKNKSNLAPKVQTALLNAANKTHQKEVEDKKKIDSDTIGVNSSQSKPNKNSTNTTNTKLKGVSLSLLERIRQKEQNKMQLAMTRDPEKEEKLSQMQRLPDICRILKSYFTTERKVAITLEDCVQKLSESYGTALNLVKLDEHIRLLSELVPEWLTIVLVRKFPFVKVTKGYDLNKVINALNTIQTKESEV